MFFLSAKPINEQVSWALRFIDVTVRSLGTKVITAAVTELNEIYPETSTSHGGEQEEFQLTFLSLPAAL